MLPLLASALIVLGRFILTLIRFGIFPLYWDKPSFPIVIGGIYERIDRCAI